MSTTPSTSDGTGGSGGRDRPDRWSSAEHGVVGLPEYTVVGGNRIDRLRSRGQGTTLAVLNRRGRFDRQDQLQELVAGQVDEVLLIEGPNVGYDVEESSRRYPAARFLVVRDDVTIGERVNLAMEESRSEHVLVVWADMRLLATVAGLIDTLDREELLAVTPVLRSDADETLPVIHTPAYSGSELTFVPGLATQTGMRTLFPTDFVALYRRDRFLRTGGFDRRLVSPYWQCVDFGSRAALWGESIVCSTAMPARYRLDPPAVDTTRGGGYKLFYLKNVAVRLRGDTATLPYRRFPGYAMRTDSGPVGALHEFATVRTWVYRNRYRFRADMPSLARQWGDVA